MNELKDNKKISVNMVTLNQGNFIEKAIKSVIDQTYKNWELIIVDNGSTDETAEIISKYLLIDNRIAYYRQKENIGITKSRNLALKHSTGEFIAVLDSDDVWLEKDKLEKQTAFLESNPDYAVVGTNSKIIDQNSKEIGEIVRKEKDEDIKDHFLLKNQFTHSSVLFLKEALEKIGGYDEKIYIWEDYSTILKIGEYYKLANLPDFSTGYRKHEKNISKKKRLKGIITLEKIVRQNRKTYPKFWTAYLLVFLRFLAVIFKVY